MASSRPPAILPENLARFAEAQVAAGRYASVDEVIRAGVRALQAREEAEQEWLDYARRETADAFAELDRGEAIAGTADELMARIDAPVDQQVQK